MSSLLDCGFFMAETTLEKQLDLSVQEKTDKLKGALGFPMWFRLPIGKSDIAPWWSPKRDEELYKFAFSEGNDILQGAISSIVKKFKAMNWTIEAGSRLAKQYQSIIAEAEFGKGWSFFLGKFLTDYLTQDKGAFAELIGEGNPLGPIEGPVLGIAHLDSQYCMVTDDIEYPVYYAAVKSKSRHKIHHTRLIHLVDMPSPRHDMLDIGFCAVSRVIAASSVLLKLAQYKNEKLSDLPEAGLLLLNNILQTQWDDVKAEAEQKRQKRGNEFWRNVLTLIGLDPEKPVTAELISFANLPEGFDEQEWTELYINILALAFGVDPREFWPVNTGSFGSSADTLVQHQKAKGKGVGELISSLEREINWKVLPETVTFEFDFLDDEEDLQTANIIKVKTDTIMSMITGSSNRTSSQASINDEPIVSRDEIRRMLAENVPYFRPEFLDQDPLDKLELTDTDKKMYLGDSIIKIDSKGRILNQFKPTTSYKNRIIAQAEENYKQGRISLDDVIEFKLGMELEDVLDVGFAEN